MLTSGGHMKRFTYKAITLLTGKSKIHRMNCYSEEEFLEELAKWNRYNKIFQFFPLNLKGKGV